MGITPEEMERYAPYIAGWKRRWRRIVEGRLERAAAAREAAERCARLLAERHGARRVWLIGSALTPERFDERSDLDLAVEGVRCVLRAGADCEAVAPGFELDLIPLEEVEPPARRQALTAHGELLHGPPA